MQTRSLIKAIMTGIAPVIREFVDKMVGEAVAPLKQRVADLEARPVVKYLGTWAEGTEYREGSMVTHDGSTWHCSGATRDRPGASPFWTLAVKRGRDGKR